MLELVNVGVAIVGPDGVVLRANEAATSALGRVPAGDRWADWIGTFARLDDGTDVPAERPVTRALQGETVAAERFRRGDQILELAAAPLFDEAVVTVDDVTAEHRGSQAEHDFVANAAHQMRTPISIISSVLAALRAGAMHEPQTLERFLAHMEGAVDRLSRVTEALLTLARVQGGSKSPARVVFVHDVLRRAIDDREATLDCEPGVATIGDAALLLEAVSNVVDNAYAHGAPPVELTCRSEGGATVVTVRDHGPGIPAAERKDAVRRFFGKGTGLGLAITADAVRASQGTLSLEDAPGGGLLVRLTLPPGRLL